MQHRLLFFLFFAFTMSTMAQEVNQQVMATAGSYNVFTEGSLSWTIGESLVETHQNGTMLTTGFQQPEINLVNYIDQPQTDKQVIVYPNPVKNILTVNLEGMTEGEYEFELTTITGVKVKSFTEQANGMSKVLLNMEFIPSGFYLLNVTSKSNFRKVIKIEICN